MHSPWSGRIPASARILPSQQSGVSHEGRGGSEHTVISVEGTRGGHYGSLTVSAGSLRVSGFWPVVVDCGLRTYSTRAHRRARAHTHTHARLHARARTHTHTHTTTTTTTNNNNNSNSNNKASLRHEKTVNFAQLSTDFPWITCRARRHVYHRDDRTVTGRVTS